jgi:hypothetical protein
MTVKRRSSRRRGVRGTAHVEFAIMMPLLFLVGFCAIEFGRIMSNYQKLSNLSYESAKAAFKSCRGTANPQKLGTCLDGVMDVIGPLAQSSGLRDPKNPANPEIIISIYERARNGTTISLVGQVKTEGAKSESRWTVERVTELRSLQGTRMRRLIIGEVFHTHAILPSFTRFVFPQQPKVIYESTIF